MLVPNKIISYQESIISKMLIILDDLKLRKHSSLIELFHAHSHYYNDIEEFIYSLDVLFILDVIDLDVDSGVIKYVETNTM